MSQQPLIGSSSNFKIKLRGANQNKFGFQIEMKPALMEDDLKILKVKYLSNR
jgi:hypothetical protein